MAHYIKFTDFNGDRDRDFVSWRDDVLRKFKFLKWSIENQVLYFPTLLKDGALHFYESLSEETKSNLDQTLLALTDRYGRHSDILQRVTMFQRTQKSDEKVHSYTTDILHNIRVMQVHDPISQMAYFLRGILPYLRYEIIKMRPKTLQQCEDIALLLEDINHYQHEDNRTPEQRDTSNSPIYRPTRTDTTLQPKPINRQRRRFCNSCNCEHIFGKHPIHKPFCNSCRDYHIYGEHVIT